MNGALREASFFPKGADVRKIYLTQQFKCKTQRPTQRIVVVDRKSSSLHIMHPTCIHTGCYIYMSGCYWNGHRSTKRQNTCDTHTFLYLQLARSGGRWSGGVHWHQWGGDHHGCHDARGAWQREGPGLLLYIHPLWNPPLHDLGSVCINHSISWSQPGGRSLFSDIMYTIVNYQICKQTLSLDSNIQSE